MNRIQIRDVALEWPRLFGLLWLFVFLAACNESVTAPKSVLVIEHEGRLERGSTVRFSATLNGTPATAVLWTADPVTAVQWTAPGEARLLTTGIVRIFGASGKNSGSDALTVTLPPSLLFERAEDGQNDIWRMALDGGDLVRLVQNSAQDRWPTAAAGLIYFVSYRVAPAAVFAAPITGGSGDRVSTASGVYEEAAISPDGRNLLFTRASGGVNKLFISDPTGANAYRADPSSGAAIEVSPAWSSDGKRITYVSTAAGNADIYVVNVDGGAAQAVVKTPATEVEPAWSPDGKQIVFARSTSSGTHLFTIDITSHQEHQITSQPGTQARPVWLTDGRIAFTVTSGSQHFLYWVDPTSPDPIHEVAGSPDIAGRLSVLP